MKILRVICSPRGSSSESYRLSQTIVNNLIDRHRDSGFIITERGVGGLAPIGTGDAETLSTPRDPSDVDRSNLLQAEQLIRELESADYVVIATPIHNLTIPSALKAWLDHVIQPDRTFRITPEGKVVTPRDRPVFVAVSSGGTFSADNARQPDFLTPYLKAALAAIGLLNVTFFSVEGTAQKESVMSATREKTERDMAFYFSSHPHMAL